MCFKVACRNCGKFSWSGCGKHLKTLYASINQGQHCMCKSWPGVVIPSADKEEQPSAAGSASEGSTGDAKA
ncbi:hypothetical protein QQ045_008580 [Rhodiola kirilowii]